MDKIPTAMREARLIKGRPEEVFQDLVARADVDELETEAERQLNRLLLARHEPLIDLALAHASEDREVLAYIYERSLEEPSDASDERFRLGLRVACLSNTRAGRFSFFTPGFPSNVIGEKELARIVQSGADEERSALIQNPEVDPELLKALYVKTGPFENLDEDVRSSLVYASARNRRIFEQRDSYDGPDSTHYGIHRAIFLDDRNRPAELVVGSHFVQLFKSFKCASSTSPGKHRSCP